MCLLESLGLILQIPPLSPSHPPPSHDLLCCGSHLLLGIRGTSLLATIHQNPISTHHLPQPFPSTLKGGDSKLKAKWSNAFSKLLGWTMVEKPTYSTDLRDLFWGLIKWDNVCKVLRIAPALNYYILVFGIFLAASWVSLPFWVGSAPWCHPIYAEQLYSQVRRVKHFI